MLLVISPGQVNGEGKVKDAIVNVLRNEWPLSLKEIYFAVIKNYSLNVSHQAVHKALKKLVENKVLVKQERRYCLNIAWIREIKQFGTSLEQAYQQQPAKESPLKISDLEKLRTNQHSTIGLKKTQPREYKTLQEIIT